MKKLLLACSLLALFGAPALTPIFADESSPETTPSPVTISLDIETSSATLFHETLSVSACQTFPESAVSTVNAYCALEQSGLSNVWTWYGEDAFLDSTNGISNDTASGSYWTWFSNVELGTTALNKHQLTTNETLLLTIGTLPLKINISNTSPEVNSPTEIRVSKFSFDSDFNPVWLPASGSTVHIGSYTSTTDETGVATFTATTTEQLDVYATQTDFLPTAHLTLTPIPVSAVETSASVPQPTSSGSGGGAVKPAEGDGDAALAFLLKNQRSDGSFGNPLQNDWAAIALASSDAGHTELGSLTPHLLQNKELQSATDYERHAMALEAADINPYSDENVIQKIISKFDGTQMGDPSTINDDIFALIPLVHAGYTADDEIIQKEITTVLSAQNDSGAWENVDLTSATIQALAPFSDISSVSTALTKAREYVHSHEDSDGCFGNSYTTSWALQAIAALKESPSAWSVWGGSTPLTCMALLQASDGGFGSLEATVENRIWATAYAIPALQGKSWDILLTTFPKQVAIVTVSTEPSKETASTTLPTFPPTTGTVAGTSTARVAVSIATLSEKKPKDTAQISSPIQPREFTPVATTPPTLLSAIEKYVVTLVSSAVALFHR